MQPLDVNDKELVLCPMREQAQAEEDRYVSIDWCEGCKYFGGALRGGGGAAGMATIGDSPTKINCNAI